MEGLQVSSSIRRRTSSLARTLAGITLVGLCGCERPQTPAQPVSAPATGPSVERGRYLVTIAVCNDCHTPLMMGPKGPEPDMSRMLSGHPQLLTMPAPPDLGNGPWLFTGGGTNTAWSGPWGISYTSNLTPDKTGLGLWTEQMFIDAMRTGKQMGNGRPILPPMPWPWYGQMTDDDLKSIFMYLKSIPPVSNQVPPAVIAPGPG
jgi:hypothetical protein